MESIKSLDGILVLIKHLYIFWGVILHVQQNVVKCLIIPLPRFSYIYWLIHFNTWLFPKHRRAKPALYFKFYE